MTLTLPFLLIILHFSQIGLTDDLTFIVISPFAKVHLLLYHSLFQYARTTFQIFIFFTKSFFLRLLYQIQICFYTIILVSSYLYNHLFKNKKLYIGYYSQNKELKHRAYYYFSVFEFFFVFFCIFI